MKALLIGTCLAVATIANEARFPAAFKAPGASELAILRSQDGRSLAELRGGRIDTSRPLTDSERARARSLESQYPELADLRAGDTNSTLITILLVVAIVAVVLIII